MLLLLLFRRAVWYFISFINTSSRLPSRPPSRPPSRVLVLQLVCGVVVFLVVFVVVTSLVYVFDYFYSYDFIVNAFILIDTTRRIAPLLRHGNDV